MTTEVEQTAAVKALLSAAQANPFTLQELADMTNKPSHYCEVMVTERVTEFSRYGGRSDVRSWRAQVRSVARYEDNAKTNRSRVGGALEDRTVTVGGIESTPMRRGASDDPVRPDDGWWSALSEFNYDC